MLRRMLSAMLIVAMLGLAPILAGCQKEEVEIERTSTVTIEEQPIGEPEEVITE